MVWVAYTEELCEQAAEEFSMAWQSIGDRHVELFRHFGPHRVELDEIRGGFLVAGLQKLHRDSLPRQAEPVCHPPGSAEDIATKAITERRSVQRDKGESDKSEKLPVAEREKQLQEELVSEGVPEPQAKQIAVEYVRSNVKFLFQEAEIPVPVMFDVKSKAGTLIVLINTKHPAREHFFDLLKQEGAETDTPAQKALKLLLSAWARLEDEAAGSGRKEILEDARQDWGRLARDFLQAAND